MSFCRIQNAHDLWRAIVGENSALLRDLPAEALSSQDAFRGYVTDGVHQGIRLEPPVSALSPKALQDLWIFINVKAEFDMDATLFDAFNIAYRKPLEGEVHG